MTKCNSHNLHTSTPPQLTAEDKVSSMKVSPMPETLVMEEEQCEKTENSTSIAADPVEKEVPIQETQMEVDTVKEEVVAEVNVKEKEEIMKEINQAYSTLSDEVSRAEYDFKLEKGDMAEEDVCEEEIVKVFEEFFDEVQQAANEWALKQAMKGKKVNKAALNLFISDHLLDNREYFTTKYKLHSEVFKAFRDTFQSNGSGGWGKKRNRRRK